VPNFVSVAASVAELSDGEKSRTVQSINHSPGLFDALPCALPVSVSTEETTVMLFGWEGN